MQNDKLIINEDLLAQIHNANIEAIKCGEVDIYYADCFEQELRKLLCNPLNTYTLSIAVSKAVKRVSALTHIGEVLDYDRV